MPNSSTPTPETSRPFIDPRADDDLRERFAQYLIWTDSSRDVIGVRRIFIDIAGDLVAGVILSQLLYWCSPAVDTGYYKMADKEYWVAKSRKDWYEECRVSPKQIDRAFEALKKSGLIETKTAPFSGKMVQHFRLNYCRFLQAWEHQRKLLGAEYDAKYRRERDEIRGRALPKRRNTR